MHIGILGTGMVGEGLGSKLVANGHEVRLGSRAANSPKGAAWVAKTGARASQGTFAQAASFGELVFNCTLGTASVDAVEAAGTANLAGKILVDVANPLDFSRGMPPSLAIPSTDSLGERLQRALPGTRVVKALNTVSVSVMVDPKAVGGGEHDLFLCGNDAGAKGMVRSLLREEFGWTRFVDLGDISASRGTEGYLLLWLRLYGANKTPLFNVRVVT